jgi:anti-sigma factor RsiW
MRCEELLERLDEFVDGDLPTDEARRISSHVEGCAACSAAVDELRALAARSAELPRSIEPERDLWPELAARIESEKVVPGAFGGSARRFLLAASLAVVAVGAVVIAYTVGRQQGPPTIVRVAPTPEVVTASAGPPSFGIAEVEFQNARQQLLATLEQRRHTLSPETLQVVDDNLQLIDAAIGRISVALAENPDNPQLSLQLASAYRRQIDLLWRANRLPAET